MPSPTRAGGRSRRRPHGPATVLPGLLLAAVAGGILTLAAPRARAHRLGPAPAALRFILASGWTPLYGILGGRSNRVASLLPVSPQPTSPQPTSPQPGPPQPAAGLAAGPPRDDAPLALLPGIAFGWTAPGTEALLAFQIRPGATGLERITNVRLPVGHLVLAGYRIEREAGKLLLRVRADRSGELAVRRLALELRYAPERTLKVHGAEVMALPDAAGPLALRRWASDDAVGLYAAFALVNEGAAPVEVRSLRYASRRLGRGLLLADTGPPDAFETWKDGVLERTVPAFGAYLLAHGHDPRAPTRRLSPTSLAFPLGGALAGARWRASDALDARVAPGDALFLAVTPAAFSAYVDDLAIAAYPVMGYETAAGCCRRQGIPAPILHVVAPGRARRPGRTP